MTPSIKELQELAKACRKAGITHFKSEHFEFTLGDEKPVTKRRPKNSVKPQYEQETDIKTDSLEGDALLFWSSVDVATQVEEERASEGL